MEKPDLKKLGTALGEDIAQDVVKKILRPFAEYYITQSENKIDDILLPFFDELEAAIVEALDDIDGVEGS